MGGASVSWSSAAAGPVEVGAAVVEAGVGEGSGSDMLSAPVCNVVVGVAGTGGVIGVGDFVMDGSVPADDEIVRVQTGLSKSSDF